MKNILILLLLLSITASVDARSWYVRPSATGSANGNDWNNAWSAANLNSNMSSIAGDDIVWIAGGTYSTDIILNKSGTSGHYIYLKGALSSDAVPTAAAGWQASFACNVTKISFVNASLDFRADFIYVDGRTNNITTTTIAQRRNGDLTGGMGWKVQFSNNTDAFDGAAIFATGGVNDVVITNLDLSGPGPGTYASAANFNYSGDNAVVNFRPPSGSVTNVLVTHCLIHSNVNLVRNESSSIDHITIDNCVFYDSSSSNAAIHQNLIYHVGGSHWTIRYCDITGWQVEGIIMFEVGNDNAPHWVYGNIFHEPSGAGTATCFWPGSNGTSADRQGPLYLFNDVFVSVDITTAQSRSWDFSLSSVSRNNIFWSSTMAGNSDFSAGTSSHNFSNNGQGAGTGSITAGSNPFIDLTARDYHINTNISATLPRNKGFSLVNVTGSSSTFGNPETFNIDMDGNTRGSDGTWDMGAFEVASSSTPAFIDTAVIQGSFRITGALDWQ